MASNRSLSAPVPTSSPRSAPQCQLCSTTTTTRKRFLSCVSCHRYFHLSCAGLSRSQARSLSSWRCGHCSSDAPSSPPSASPSPAPAAPCAICNATNPRKSSLACGLCHRPSHLSCVGITRAQARALPLWHCSDCLQGPLAFDPPAQPAGTPPADIASALHKLRSHTRVLARIPKGVRLLVADELAKRIRAALSEATPLAWWNLLSLAPTLLHAPDRSAPGTRPQSLSSSIRERLSATSTRTIPSVPPSHASRPSPPVSLSGDEALARRIRAKCADGDIRSALRLLSSSDSFASPTEDVIAALRAEHPPPPADQSFDTAAPRPGDRSLVASEEQVLSAVQSMPPGSSTVSVQHISGTSSLAELPKPVNVYCRPLPPSSTLS